MARWMGAKEFGIYVISFSWCILLSTCATAGMAQGAIRFVGKGLATANLPYVRGFVRRGFQVSAIGGLVTASVGSVIVLMVRDIVPAAGRMTMLMSMATVPFFAVLNYFGGAANAFPWLAQSFLAANVVRPLLFLGALWALAQEQQHYTATAAMVLQWFSFAIVAVLAGWLFQYRLAREVPTTAREYETRHWLRSAAPLLGVSIFNGYLAGDHRRDLQLLHAHRRSGCPAGELPDRVADRLRTVRRRFHYRAGGGAAGRTDRARGPAEDHGPCHAAEILAGAGRGGRARVGRTAAFSRSSGPNS